MGCVGYIMSALLVGCMEYISIGGLYRVLFYWWAVWGIALLVGCMWHSSIGGLFGVYNECSIGGLYGVWLY